MVGGGTKGGTINGETDDFSYNIVKDPVHIRDFHATILHLTCSASTTNGSATSIKASTNVTPASNRAAS